MGACGQPHVITKLMMIKKIRDFKQIMVMSSIAGTLAVFLWISIGLAMRALVVIAGSRPDRAGAADQQQGQREEQCRDLHDVASSQGVGPASGSPVSRSISV